MIADLRHYADRKQEEQWRSSFNQTLALYVSWLQDHQVRLADIAQIYSHDPQIWPVQCEATIGHLQLFCSNVRSCRSILAGLSPETTRQCKPYGALEKLTALDYQCFEMQINMVMFAYICQTICEERVRLHLHIRSLFPRLEMTLDDVLSQLSVLLDRRQEEP
jgi:hypothetical protein